MPPTATSPVPSPTVSTGVSCENVIVNGGFEEGNDGFAGWTIIGQTALSDNSHTGDFSAWLGGLESTQDWVGQENISFPADIESARLTFFVDITTEDLPDQVWDEFFGGVWHQGNPTDQNPLVLVHYMNNTDAGNGWQGFFYDFTEQDLNIVANTHRSVWFAMFNDNKDPTNAYVDAVGLEICAGSQ